MAELPKKDGLDVAFQFLNAVTGNVDKVMEARQQELNAYDTEVKREQALLNTAQSSIDNAKISKYIILDMQKRPNDFGAMSPDEFTAYIDSVPSLVGIDMQQYSDPISRITFLSGLKDTENKLLDSIQTLRTEKATNDLASGTINVLQGHSNAPDPVIPGQFIRLTDDEQAASFDALYEKGKLTGANIKEGLNDILVNYAKENASILGNTGVVKYVNDRKLTGKDFAAQDIINKGINKHADADWNNHFDNTLQDIFSGESNLSLDTQYEVLDYLVTNTDSVTKKDAMIKQLGDMIVKLGNPDYENTPLYQVFKKHNGDAIYDLASKFEAQQKANARQKAKETKEADLTDIAMSIYDKPVNSLRLDDYARLPADDQNFIMNIWNSMANPEKRIAIERSTGSLFPVTQEVLRPLDSASRNFGFSTTEFNTRSPEVQQSFITAVNRLVELDNAQVNWWTDFEPDQKKVLFNIVKIMNARPNYINDKGVGSLIAVAHRSRQLEVSGETPRNLPSNELDKFNKDFWKPVLGTDFDEFSNYDQIIDRGYTEYGLYRGADIGQKDSKTRAGEQIKKLVIAQDTKKMPAAYKDFFETKIPKNKNRINYKYGLIIPDDLVDVLTTHKDTLLPFDEKQSNIYQYSARAKQLLDKTEFIQTEMGDNIDMGQVLFKNNPTDNNTFVMVYLDENGDELYSQVLDWDVFKTDDIRKWRWDN